MIALADIKRCQREHYGQSVQDLHFAVGVRVYVRRPLPTSQPKGFSARFTRHFDGPFEATRHVHRRQDLLELRHETTGHGMYTSRIRDVSSSGNFLKESEYRSIRNLTLHYTWSVRFPSTSEYYYILREYESDSGNICTHMHDFSHSDTICELSTLRKALWFWKAIHMTFVLRMNSRTKR